GEGGPGMITRARGADSPLGTCSSRTSPRSSAPRRTDRGRDSTKSVRRSWPRSRTTSTKAKELSRAFRAILDQLVVTCALPNGESVGPTKASSLREFLERQRETYGAKVGQAVVPARYRKFSTSTRSCRE